MKNTYYLIIGNGIAGHEARMAIRKNDEKNSVMVVGEERYHTYRRVQLSQALATDQEIDDLYVDKKRELVESNIDTIIGQRVLKIDTENRKVILDNDEEISYEKLLITTGSNSFIPPYDGDDYENIYKLRNYDDLLAIRKNLDDYEHVVVSGGGLLGLELAYSLILKNKKVDVIEFGAYLLNRQLDYETSSKLEEDLNNLGIKVHTGVSVKRVLGDEKLDQIFLTSGELISADALIFSVGVRANIDIIPDEINTKRGIIVDHKLRTNVENIWSAGDCVEIEGRGFGLWTASNQMGKIAGNNMSGKDEEYYPEALFTNMKLGDIKVYSIGKITDDSIREEKEDEIRVLFFKNDILVGGILYGNLKDMGKLNKDIKEGKSKEAFKNA